MILHSNLLNQNVFTNPSIRLNIDMITGGLYFENMAMQIQNVHRTLLNYGRSNLYLRVLQVVFLFI